MAGLFGVSQRPEIIRPYCEEELLFSTYFTCPRFQHVDLDNKRSSASGRIIHGISWDEIKRLCRGYSLPDNMITEYFRLIQERNHRLHRTRDVPMVYLLSVQSGDGISRSTLYTRVFDDTLQQQLGNDQRVLIPLRLDDIRRHHWCLAMLDIAEKRVEFYTWHERDYRVEMDNITFMFQRLFQNDPYFRIDHKGKWEIGQICNLPTHDNDEDCGVFLCQFAELIARNRHADFDSKHAPYFRQKMFLELMNQWVLFERQLPPDEYGWSSRRMRLYANHLVIENGNGFDLQRAIILDTTSKCYEYYRSYRSAFIPIWVPPPQYEQVGGHWLLAVADLQLRQVTYYVPSPLDLDLIEMLRLEQTSRFPMRVRFVLSPESVYEPSSHCSVFSCNFAERLSCRIGDNLTEEVVAEICDEIESSLAMCGILNKIAEEVNESKHLNWR